MFYKRGIGTVGVVGLGAAFVYQPLIYPLAVNLGAGVSHCIVSAKFRADHGRRPNATSRDSPCSSRASYQISSIFVTLNICPVATKVDLKSGKWNP